MQIEVEVKGQRIKRINSPGSVEDTLNYLTCHFIFSGEEWDNTVKTAYFRNPASGEKYQKILADDGTCTVPWEALTDKGFVRFSVAGERDGYRITTGIESFYNSETIYGGQPSEPPTPDQYDQMIALAEQTKEIAESVRRDADEGKFDGPPGPQGPKGENGDPGPQGPAGEDGQDATDEQVRGAVDAYMAEHPVQVDTDDLIKIAIKEEASGAVPIVTTDSAEMGVQDLTMQGWTEQESTTGANLIDYTQAIPRNENQSVEIIDGGVKWTGDYYFIIPVAGLKKNQNYIMSYKSDDAGGWVFSYSDGTFSPQRLNGRAGTTDPEKDCDKVIVYKSNPTVSGQDMVFTDIMLNEGSTALPYEPYTGGQPSPNPEYPQEIVSAGKYNEEAQKYEYQVKLTGKNLWNAEEAAETSKWVASKTQKGYSDFAIDVAPGQQITFSFPEKLPLGITMYVAIVSIEDGEATKWLYHSTSENLIVQQATITAITDKIWVRCNTGSIEGFVQDNPYFQIEYGSKRTAFQPYKEQTVTLTADRPLTKWDKLEKRNGQWGWAYKSAEIVLDGSKDEAWSFFGTDSFNQFYINIDTVEHLSDEKNAYCKKFRPAVIADRGAEKEIIYSANGAIAVSTELATELDAWKTWIQSNPITVLYRSIEETFVPLSASEQEQMNALHTYYPTTILDNDQGCDMALTYIADTKAYIDNKVSAIQAAIVNAI